MSRRLLYRCQNASCAQRGIPNEWAADVAENIDPVGMDERCAHCGFKGAVTGMGYLAVGGDEVFDQLLHGLDCKGWIVHAIEMRASGDAKIAVPTFRDCPTCRPGKAAVFEAGLMVDGWGESPRAIKVYLQAELTAGRDWPAEFPNGLWRKVAKEIAGGL